MKLHYILKNIISLSIPRILGFINRNNCSSTYGCSERTYWHYKLKDFTNIRFQEACLLLTLLYKNQFPENILFNKKWTLNLIKAIIDYSLKIQNKDGSFNEVYPYERSFCASSFFTVALTETLLSLSELKNNKIISCLIKTGDWLNANQNENVVNQQIAATLALFNISALTDLKEYNVTAKKRYKKIISDFNKKGFFNEYDGLDIGYTSISLGLLKLMIQRKYIQEEKCFNSMLETIDKATNESGNFDYKKYSRKTNYLYIYGLLKNKTLINKITIGVKNNKIPNPLWMDDRYLIPFLTDYLLAYIEVK